MNKRPMVFITLAYISGIIFGRYFFISWWICIFVLCILSVALFVKGTPPHQDNWKYWKRICFYLCISVIGYFIYKLTVSIVPISAVADGVNSGPHRLDLIREHIRMILYYNVPFGEERNLFAGLFLGERYKISAGLIDIFRCTNTMHILAISGLHVGFIGLILVGVLRLLFIPRKIAAILAIAGVLLYVSMVGWRPPAFRAAVIFCILLMGWVLDRPVDSINSLFLAALVILLITPEALFRLGFQLSFVIVFSLLLVTPVIARGKNYFVQAFGISLTAWLSSLPLTAYYFRIISPISILANIVVVPAVGIMIALGFTSILLGQLYLPISGIFNSVNYYLAKSVIWLIDYLAYIPGAYFHISRFPGYIIFIYYIVLYLTFFFLLQKKSSVVK